MIALMILLIAILGVFQFGSVMLFKQTVMHACIVGSRESAKGASTDEVEDSINAILANHALEIGDRATFRIEGLGADVIRGTLDCPALDSPVVDSDEVRVTICVDIGRRPFWNPLRFFGVDLTGRTMTVYSAAPKE